MKSQVERLIELTRFRGEVLNPKLCAAQKKYYSDMADWIEEQNFETVEQSMEAIKSTPFYLGGVDAFETDYINMRLETMKEIGYDDVVAIHSEILKKLQERGAQDYCFSQDWIDDLTRVNDEIRKYSERKQVFGKIFSGYFQLSGNPQQEHRKTATDGIKKGLDELEKLGVTFDELAGQKAYRKLTMATDVGMKNFIDFIHEFMKIGEYPEIEMNDARDEMEVVGNWAAAHAGELKKVGGEEKWHCANCIAVPSDDPMGYDYIAMKEVEQ